VTSLTGSGRKRLRREERRGLILAAAAPVFAERGYAGATIAQIAKDAGVVKSVVYDHFGSKQELYVELLRQHADALTSHVFDSDASGSSLDRFRARTDAFFEFVERDPFAWRMLFRDPPAGDPTIAALHSFIHARARDAIREQFAATRSLSFEFDVPRTMANEMAAQAVKSINDGLAAWWYEHRDVPREVVTGIAVDLAWRGIEQFARGSARVDRGRT
jgi:AcrR family transcriptional regulator